MLAEVITIGDEILIGQIVDSNSAFIGQELNKIGIDVHQISSVQDDKQHIINALEEAKNRVDLVLITGGLGPTKDDITKHTICEYFDDTLIENDAVLRNIELLFAKYINAPITDINKKQALVPTKARVLMNNVGTAPGMWLEKDGTIFISMPGVPYEMKNLMKDEVLPRLREKSNGAFIIHKTVMTYGVGESMIAKKIEDWENHLPSYIKLAYLPSFGRVRLRLSARGKDEPLLNKALEDEIASLHNIIGDIIVGYDDQSLEEIIAQKLISKSKTLAVAESCTGGKIAESLTAYPGASSYFMGGVVTYATQSKTDVLGVSKDIIENCTVTSKEVAEAMANGVREKFKSDYAIATTGNAGPSKGDGNVEVGTVFIAIATPDTIFSEKFIFGKLREKTIGRAVSKSFELLLDEIK